MCVDLKFCETSQNSDQRDSVYFYFHQKMLKISAFYHDKQKGNILKKI